MPYNRDYDDQRPDDSQADHSWADDSPSRSARYPSDSIADAPTMRGPASRPLPHGNGRRDLAPIANNSSVGKPAPLGPPKPAGPGAPMIITGDGKVSPVRPSLRRQQPRSRGMRVTFISFATCILLALLFAATPITAGASGQVGNFIAGTNAWKLPTATPTPTPTLSPTTIGGPGTGYNPGATAVINEIKAVFGGYSAGALGVAKCESGYDPNAWNGISIMGSHAEGVFQILYPSTWQGTAYASYSPYNASANIRAAYQIFSRDGFTWREWQCQP
jgi:hypothetical protein